MKKLFAIPILIGMGLILSCCAASAVRDVESRVNGQDTDNLTLQRMEKQQEEPLKTEKNFVWVELSVGGVSCKARFYDNETTQALFKKMPLTIEMQDLNDNEKYYDLQEKFPYSMTEQPDIIHAGEIMLWSSNTLVLFYKTFENSYGGYVRLGSVENMTELLPKLESDEVTVTLSLD